MLKHRLIGSVDEFSKEFKRCCRDYDSIHIASAWCGNPKKLSFFSLLNEAKKKIKITIGVAFDKTDPEAIEFFMKTRADLRIYGDENNSAKNLFHPKCYLFQKENKIALFVGSSNLTAGGFCANIEANILTEGVPSGAEIFEIEQFIKEMERWRSADCSFTPDEKWLDSYKERFEKRNELEKTLTDNKFDTDIDDVEEQIPEESYLGSDRWDEYYGKIQERLRENDYFKKGYSNVLRLAKEKIPLPWDISYFNDSEKRRIMFGGKKGISDYGFFGHIGANGNFRGLLANGSEENQATIVAAINQIGKIDYPIETQSLLLKQLKNLTNITHNRVHFTMKSWGRLLCLVRPDLYCTVANKVVREELSKLLKLNMRETEFEEPERYIELLKVIHNSPWFQSDPPKYKEQKKIWDNRVALIDAVLYPF